MMREGEGYNKAQCQDKGKKKGTEKLLESDRKKKWRCERSRKRTTKREAPEVNWDRLDNDHLRLGQFHYRCERNLFLARNKVV
jgi:hypothetical protein